jgi:tRNA G18 (ribose-2'-O)-methylase SpoU
MDELSRLTVEAYQQAPKFPVVVLLDDIRSAHNAGSAFRTADAFLIEKIVLCGITGRPPHREITKTALGADESVAWEYYLTAHEAVTALRSPCRRLRGNPSVWHQTLPKCFSSHRRCALGGDS